MGYLFSIIAFLILIPVILKINLGIKTSAKITILAVAFLLSLIGVLAVPLLGIIKTMLILILLTIIIGYVLGNRITEIDTDIVATSDVETIKAPPKNKVIVVEEQNIEEEDPAYEVITDIKHDETIEIDEDVTFLDQRDALVQVESSSNEAAPTQEDRIEIKSDWLNELNDIEEELPEENQTEHKKPLDLDIDSEKLEELIIEEPSNWLNDISELQDDLDDRIKEKEGKEEKFMISDHFEDLEELEVLEEFTEKKEDVKTPIKEQVVPDYELDTLDELFFETVDEKKR